MIYLCKNRPVTAWFCGVALVIATALPWQQVEAGHTRVGDEVAMAAQSSPTTLDTAHFHFVYGQPDHEAVVKVAARGEQLYSNLQLILGLPDRTGAARLTVEIAPAAAPESQAPGGYDIRLTSPAAVAARPKESRERSLYRALKEALVRHMLKAALRPAPPKAQWASMVTALHSWLVTTADGAPAYAVAVQRLRWSGPRVRPPLATFLACAACTTPNSKGSGSGDQPATRLDLGPLLLDFLVVQYGVQVIPPLLGGFHTYDDWETLAPAVLGAPASKVEAAWLQGTGMAAATPATAATPVTASVLVTMPVELAAEQMVAKVPVGSSPHRIAVGEGGVWVTNEDADTVSRIDPQTNAVVATIAVGTYPRSLAIGFGSVWIANNDAGTISRIDPATNAVIATIPVDPGARGITAGAGAIWIASGVKGTVARIDPATNQVTTKIEVGGKPAQMVALDDAVWVTNRGSYDVTRIDPATNAVAAKVDVGCMTIGLAADAAVAWAACETAPNLFRIDPATNQVAAKIGIGVTSYGIALDAERVWVTSDSLNTLTAVDPHTNKVAAVYKVGSGPVGIAVGEGSVWVGMRHDNTVWRMFTDRQGEKVSQAPSAGGRKGSDAVAMHHAHMFAVE